jgi:hypothetical protein
MASIKAALLFLIIGSPFMYKLTQQLLGSLFTISSKGCPTTAGLLLHAVVLGLISYLLMGLCKEAFEDMEESESFEDAETTEMEGFEDNMEEEGFENAKVYKRSC